MRVYGLDTPTTYVLLVPNMASFERRAGNCLVGTDFEEIFSLCQGIIVTRVMLVERHTPGLVS